VAGRGRDPSHRERWVAAKFFFLRSGRPNSNPIHCRCRPAEFIHRYTRVERTYPPLSQNRATPFALALLPVLARFLQFFSAASPLA